jgi:hypothetical protein
MTKISMLLAAAIAAPACVVDRGDQDDETNEGIANMDAELATPRFAPVLCTTNDATCPITTVDLTPLVDGWAGARISFVAHLVAADLLYVTSLSIEGGAEGVYIERPLFVSYPCEGDPMPDLVDRFFNVELNVNAGEPAQPIGVGTATFGFFNPTHDIAIRFATIDRYRQQ